ncbi:MAG: hypothetical protein JRF63_12735, partial [Deltaproteobacteria bacterium]|nr:hypothetical protein [Deltaproteobacteria bacterium]
FDTRALLDTMVFPTIVVRAQDSVGNQSSLGMVVTLDNQPPLISLDPPRMREYKFNAESKSWECSWLFDPLGGYDPFGDLPDPDGDAPDAGDAADDGQTVWQLTEIRVRVEDRGNEATSGSGVLIPHSGVDPVSVQLFVLDDEDGALLVDTNDDGYCDEINPLLKPTSVPMAGNEAAVIDLVALEPSGQADFTGNPDPAEDPGQPFFSGVVGHPEAALPCTIGTVSDQPLALCFTSPGTRIGQTPLGELPIIYSIPPVNDDVCYGTPFDSVATNISDGWACVAVRALDYLGNVGISAPLRLCFDSDGNQDAGCGNWGDIDTDPAHDCTGTYDAASDQTNAAEDCVLVDVGAGKSWLYEDYPWRQLRRIDL